MASADSEALRARRAPPVAADGGSSARRALAARMFKDARVRTLGFAYLFALYSYIQPVGYRDSYRTAASRLAFSHSFASNKALRLFYGYPYDSTSVRGYSAWRVGGTLAILAAVFGLLAVVRAMRTEEDSGRMELVLAGRIGRRGANVCALAAITAGILVLWLAETLGFVLGGLPLAGSAYLALATASVTTVFAGVGALVSQLAPSRRLCLELGSALVVLMLMLRVIADTTSASWLRWLTPLGWPEQMRPFTGEQPLVLALPILASVLLWLLATRIALRRDIGMGLLTVREERAPKLRLLSSPIAQALRGERASLLAWAAGIGGFALVLGVISQSVSSADISQSIRHEIAKLGSGSIASPTGYISFVFVFFVLALSLFVCAQVGAARHEEADEQLETLLATRVSRGRWLGGRLLLAALAASGLALLSGLCAWLGAASAGVHIPLSKMIEAGANGLPVAALFLGVALLAYALTPRASAGISYGLVTVAFLWQLVGSLLSAPKWLVEVTPFAHVGLVPTQPFQTDAAIVMVAIGLLAASAALGAFRRRDLLGA